MWWMLLAPLAVAGPSTGATPSVRVPVTLPEGVVVSPTARELATKPRSSAVTFSVEGRPEIRDGRLVVRGTLVNAGTRAVSVFLTDAPETGGPFVLTPRGATFRAPLPEGKVAPEEWVLPAGARVPFESALVLADWDWPAGGAEIDWTFRFWLEPVTGTLDGRLSPPKG